MKKLDKRSIFILVVTISFLIAMVIYGAYAVINVSPQVNTNNLNIHSNISGPLSFTVEGGNIISLNIISTDMDQTLANNYVASGNDNLTIRMETDGKQNICCTYKIAWEWIEDSTQVNQYTKSEGDFEKEFSLTGNNNYYTFDMQLPNYDSSNRTNNVYTSAQICNRNSNNELVSVATQTWDFTGNFYNLNVNQDAFKNSSFRGKAKVVDVNCDTTTSLDYYVNPATKTSSQDSSTYAIVNEAGGLRYQGKDPDNYVCFKSTCSDDELYRIIGKFSEKVDAKKSNTPTEYKNVIKLVKNTAFAMPWEEKQGSVSVWQDSSLLYYLNNNWTRPYYDILDTRYRIVFSSCVDSPAEEYEALLASRKLDFISNVSIMYPTDYAYAVLESQCARTTDLAEYGNCHTNDWLYYGSENITESGTTWLQATRAINSGYACHIDEDGYAYLYSLSSSHVHNSYGVKPVFYIDAATVVTSGNGSKSTPYIIAPRNVNTITFSIDGNYYTAEEGMSIRDWVTSSYNTGGFVIYDDKLHNSDKNLICHLSITSTITNNQTITLTSVALNDIVIAKSNLRSISNNSVYDILSEKNGIRYEGSDPDNYVCFKSSCTDDELYRMIGKFTEMADTNNDGTADTETSVVKLLKYTPLSTLKEWSTTNINNWSTATLNTYLNSTWTKPTDSIVSTRWYLGGYNIDNKTPSMMYSYERGDSKYSDSYPDYVDAKVGLMYPSDYGYAVRSYTCARTVILGQYDDNKCNTYNWIYTSVGTTTHAWTITHNTDQEYSVYKVGASGKILSRDPNGAGLASVTYSVIPSFYLPSTTAINSGDGSHSNPYKIVS